MYQIPPMISPLSAETSVSITLVTIDGKSNETSIDSDCFFVALGLVLDHIFMWLFTYVGVIGFSL